MGRLRIRPVPKRVRSEKLPTVMIESLETDEVEVYFKTDQIEPVGYPFEENKHPVDTNPHQNSQAPNLDLQ